MAISAIMAAVNLRDMRGGSVRETGTGVTIRANTKQYQASIKRAQRDLARLDGKIDEVQANAARTPSPRQSMTDRLRARGFGFSSEGLQYKALKIGGGGFQIEGGALVGGANTALVAVAATRGAGAALGAINKFNRFRAEGTEMSEAALRVGRDALSRTSRQVAEFVGAPKLVAEVGELFGLGPAEQLQETVINSYAEFFTTQAERREQEMRRKEFIEEATNDIDEQLAAQQGQIEARLPQTFRLRNRPALRKFKKEQVAANAEAQKIKREILVSEAELQSKELQTEGD